MNDWKDRILRETGASAVREIIPLQNLWSGYGEIVQVHLDGAPVKTVVVKNIRYPEPAQSHPRGWNSVLSHRRKLKSYRVEESFYRHYSASCVHNARVPSYYFSQVSQEAMLIVMEDLTLEYPVCPDQISLDQAFGCVDWLARFHATFLDEPLSGVWPTGTYWHLETRPDEWHAMAESPLKAAASAIDRRLNEAKYTTLLHGDAKLANFCFSSAGDCVAAVDFQYTGGGVGVKDLAYFMSSCLSGEETQRYEERILERYFQSLKDAFVGRASSIEFQSLEREWRELFCFAWADFNRFLQGWSPDHWKITPAIEKQTQKALSRLSETKNLF